MLLSNNVPLSPEDSALQAMFVARKQIFVDLLKWDLPVLGGRFEVDQFDTPAAQYLIHLGIDGQHRASARLLPTMGPHLLDSLFRELCLGAVPRGPKIREITRFCLDRHQSAHDRRAARNILISGLIDYALEHQIVTFTGVASTGWFEQVGGFGWSVASLGPPRRSATGWLTGFEIMIDADTVARVMDAGIYTACGLARTFSYQAVEAAA